MSRTPQGQAAGALGGDWREPALANPCGAGYALFDDFHWTPSSTTRPGILNWVQTTITTAPTYSSPNGTQTALGIRQISTAATANTGGHIRSNETMWDGVPGIGGDWQSKCCITSDTSTSVIWSGWSSSTTTTPITANNLHFIGIRSEDGANWQGVCKIGSGAGNETVVDLGVSPSDWTVLGFEVMDAGGGSPAIYFYRDFLDDRRQMRRLHIGGMVTTTIPSGTAMYASALGFVTTSAANRVAQIDFWSLGGRVARL